MSDKPETTKGQCKALPGWAAVTLSGADARTFAQAQFMGDVLALTPEQWQWNGWLTPKGRVIALFTLLRREDDSLLLLLADADPDAFVSALSRFVFRSKVRIAHDTGLHVGGRFSPPDRARAAQSAPGPGAADLELDLGTATGPRTLRVGATPFPEDDAAAGQWRSFDLAHGLPRLVPGQEPQWTPQQLSLDRLEAYSVRKGCYPGQEIVARTHFLGQAKRGLVRLASTAAIPLADVRDETAPERAIGNVASTAGHEALAVLPLEAGDGPFLVDGLRCHRLPLLDGLAR